MNSKAIRRYFYKAIVAERNALQDFENFFPEKSQSLRTYFKKNWRKISRLDLHLDMGIWPQPLNLQRYFQAKILKTLYGKFLKNDFFSYPEFLLLLVDRYHWSVYEAAWILEMDPGPLEAELRNSRLKYLHKEINLSPQEKECSLHRPKLIAWQMGTNFKSDVAFIDHYKDCGKCQKEFSSYGEVRERVQKEFPYSTLKLSEFGGLKNKNKQFYPLYTALFILLMTGVVVTTLPQLKMIWELKSLKSIRYYEDAQAQVVFAITSSMEQTSNAESKVLFSRMPTSETTIRDFEKNNPGNVPKWLNSQLKSQVTRIFGQSKDLAQARSEIFSMIQDMKLKPANKSDSGIEEKPNGILADIYVPKQKYNEFKNKLTQLSSLSNIEENQFKNWDESRTRVMLWVKKQF